jgi:hypothetical protein
MAPLVGGRWGVAGCSKHGSTQQLVAMESGVSKDAGTPAAVAAAGAVASRLGQQCQCLAVMAGGWHSSHQGPPHLPLVQLGPDRFLIHPPKSKRAMPISYVFPPSSARLPGQFLWMIMVRASPPALPASHTLHYPPPQRA